MANPRWTGHLAEKIMAQSHLRTPFDQYRRMKTRAQTLDLAPLRRRIWTLQQDAEDEPVRDQQERHDERGNIVGRA